MCLSKLNEPPYEQSGVGYKVYNKHSYGSYSSLFYKWNNTSHFKLGQEYESSNGYVHKYYDSTALDFYPEGFHIFKNYDDALAYAQDESWVGVLQVEYSEVVAEGEQEKAPCVVARKIKLIKELAIVGCEEATEYD